MTKTRNIYIPLFIIILLFGIYFVYINFTDYKPDKISILPIYNNQVKNIPFNETLKVATFNVGFAGLDARQDSYEDGGKNSRAENKEKVLKNLDGIVDVIDNINPDFFLIQELDIDSRRSFYIDQLSYLNDKYPNYGYTYGDNNKIVYLPKPLFRPSGKVESGIATFSKFFVSSALRFSLPGQQDGFHKYFDYDRAFIEKRFELENGEELILINLHLSDFNETGLQRFEELRYINEYLEKEYNNGSYIIVGGDWNHNLPGTDPYIFNFREDWPSWLKNLPEEFDFEGFSWAIDKYTPTVRSLKTSFEYGDNFLTITDGFLVSDNLKIISVETLDYGFSTSYHNPVVLEFILEK